MSTEQPPHIAVDEAVYEQHTVALQLPSGLWDVIEQRAEDIGLSPDDYLSSVTALNIPALP